MVVNGVPAVRLSELLLCYKFQNKLFVNANSFRSFVRKISFQVIFLFKETLINFASEHLRTASVVQWSEFLATDPEVRVRFPALPNFLRSRGSGTGSTQPREDN
jgi:hypothetical protein